MTANLSAWWYLPAMALLLAGLWLLHIGLLRDRRRATPGRRRCPRCWYDLSGSAGLTCPECGYAAKGEAALGNARVFSLAVAAGLVLLLPILAVFGMRDSVRAWYALPPWWVRAVDERHAGGAGWTLDVLRDPSGRGARFGLWAGQRTLLELEEHTIRIGPTRATGEQQRRAVDLDYDGVDELVVTAFSGGAHCCETVYIYQLAPGAPPRRVARIEAGNGMFVHGPGASALFNVPDQTFDYWNAPHVSSPQPAVYYTIRGGRLVVDLRHMTMAARSGDLSQAVDPAEVRKAMTVPGSALDPRMWAYMLDLMYSGEEALAWYVFEQSWPPERPGKTEFRAEFLGVLEKSPQWRDVRAARAAAARGEEPPEASVGLSGGAGPPSPPAPPAPPASAAP